jgi:hypothetical protein
MDDRQPCSQRDTTSAMRGSDRMFVAELCRQRTHLSQSTRHAEVNERPSPSGQSSASAPAMWSSSWVPTATVAHQVISPTSGDGESDQARTESSLPAISPPHRESGGAKAVVLEVGVTVAAEPAHHILIHASYLDDGDSTPPGSSHLVAFRSVSVKGAMLHACDHRGRMNHSNEI